MNESLWWIALLAGVLLAVQARPPVRAASSALERSGVSQPLPPRAVPQLPGG